MRQVYGDHEERAARVAMGAMTEIKAAVMDGTAGKTWGSTKGSVMQVFQQASTKKGATLGPHAMTHEGLALLCDSMTQEFADLLNAWRQDLTITDMPHMWQAGILTMSDEGRVMGFSALRPVGLVSSLQRCCQTYVGGDRRIHSVGICMSVCIA